MEPITIDLNGEIGPLAYVIAYAFAATIAGGVSWRHLLATSKLPLKRDDGKTDAINLAKSIAHDNVAITAGIVGAIFLVATLLTSCQMFNKALKQSNPIAIVTPTPPPTTLQLPSPTVDDVALASYKTSGSTVPGPYYVTINDWEYTVSTEERLTVTQWEDLQYISRYNTNALAFEMRCHSLHIPISNIMRHVDGAIIFTKQTGT